MCTDLYLSLCCAQLCTDRCIGKLQSKDSARKEMKGRCKTGHVQPSEGSVPPRCWLSPTRSRGQPGSGRRRGGSPAVPGAAGTVQGCGDSPPPPGSRAQGRGPHLGHGTFLLRMGGGSVEPSGVEWDGQGTRGRGGKRWGRAGRAQLSCQPWGLMASPGWHLHRDVAKLSLLCTGALQRWPLSPGSAAHG